MLLSDALNEWQGWTESGSSEARSIKRPPELVEQFTAGLNHSTAKIRLDGELAVLKVFHKPSPNEIAAQQWASKNGVAPRLRFVDPAHRYALMDFFEGSSVRPGCLDEIHLRKLGEALRLVHSASGGPVSQQGFDIVRFCETYLDDAGSEAASLHHQIAPLLEEYQCDPTPWCFCHNDLVAANILVGTKSVILIDWEFADWHNPWFDLAALIYYLQLSDKQAADLLNAYQRIGASEVASRIFKVSQVALLWGDMLWHLAKFGESFWPELAQKRGDLMRLVSELKSSVV
jgi:hypothetical protein